jgi:hypothetical protein
MISLPSGAGDVYELTLDGEIPTKYLYGGRWKELRKREYEVLVKWDLIVLTFAWAPMTDGTFVARLRESLRPDGRIVFEHFLEDPAAPRPPAMHVLKPGRLRDALKGFRLERYQELNDLAGWGGPGMQVVRAVAAKS